jgi:hypothetical protein
MSWKGSWRVCLSCAVCAVAWIAMERPAQAHYLAGDNCHCASCVETAGCAVCAHHANERVVATSNGHRHYGSSARHGGRKSGGAKIRREGLSIRQRSGGIR